MGISWQTTQGGRQRFRVDLSGGRPLPDEHMHAGSASSLTPKSQGSYVGKSQLTALPQEIRELIYHYLYGSAQVVEPDSTASRDCQPAERRFTICDGALAFLRTCRQINDEASVFLYETRTFVFSSEVYVDDICVTSGTGGADGLYLPPEGDVLVSSSCPSWAINRAAGACSLAGFYIWLQLIGRANRKRLRRLELRIVGSEYLYAPGEHWTSKKMASEVRTSRDCPPLVRRGHTVARALELLAVDEHYLESIRITTVRFDPLTWMHLLKDPSQSTVGRALERLIAARRNEEDGDGGGVVIFFCDDLWNSIHKVRYHLGWMARDASRHEEEAREEGFGEVRWLEMAFCRAIARSIRLQSTMCEPRGCMLQGKDDDFDAEATVRIAEHYETEEEHGLCKPPADGPVRDVPHLGPMFGAPDTLWPEEWKLFTEWERRKAQAASTEALVDC